MKRQVSLPLDPETKEKLKYLAARDGRSLSNYIETVLMRHADRALGVKNRVGLNLPHKITANTPQNRILCNPDKPHRAT